MATAIESLGIDQQTKLTPEVCDALRLLLQTTKTFESAAGNQKSGPAEQLLNQIIRHLWGSDVLTPPRDENGDDANPDFGYGPLPKFNAQGEPITPEGVKPVAGGMMGMSLAGLRDTGRCTRAEFTRMSLAPAHDRAAFARTREALPEGSMISDAERRAQEEEAEGLAHWANKKGPKPRS